MVLSPLTGFHFCLAHHPQFAQWAAFLHRFAAPTARNSSIKIPQLYASQAHLKLDKDSLKF